MGHITKIAAIESATTIWEYDPALTDNRVLGGSLDVIASIRTIVIKVSREHFESVYCIDHFIRYKPLVNKSNISKSFKFSVRSLIHSESPSIVMFDGDQHIICLIAHISYARYRRAVMFPWIIDTDMIHTGYRSLPSNG